MKVLITGAKGQLGWELQRCQPEGVKVSAFSSAEVDICDPQSLLEAIDEAAPQIIINAAAYTAVDKAEQEKERAYAVNAQGVANLAALAARKAIRVVHISTDFVFDGRASSPYLPEALTNPLGVYGASKLAGEEQLHRLMAPELFTIVRTAWVYSAHGNNFVKTMLRLMAEKDKLGVVADQVGTPTWAKGLAAAVWGVVEKKITGVHHWTDAGVASWYDFAVAIQEEALALGLLDKEINISPIRSAEYPTPAARPAYSVLDKTSLWGQLKITPAHWRILLRKMLKEIKDA